MIIYFAYGSNMDYERFINRIGEKIEIKRYPGVLENYELKFNKKASGTETSYANITPAEGEKVEGILYELEERYLKMIDQFEGYKPERTKEMNHYNREKIEVKNLQTGKTEEAIVYIAGKNHLQNGLYPTEEYLEHILKGKEYLSLEYYEKLKKTGRKK